jgi:hypothetical protein
MKKKFLTIVLPVALAGCVTPGQVKENVVEEVKTIQKGPDSTPQKNYTNMQESLRCMDRLFIENGIRDLVVLTEDIVDNTKKLPVGGRDMLTSAVSDMTRRSRAIRLITFGGDVINLVNWLNASGANSRVYTFKPDFDIRGSISQMDDNLIQGRAGGGVSIGPISADKSNDANAAVLGLDLSIISTQTMELLPGVSSRNSIVVVKEGEGTGASLTGRVAKQSFGVNYDFSFNRNEGTAQAVRTLIELATIELFGKLTRVPYWTCLGVDSEHPVVKDEIGDWYYALAGEQKLVPYVQNQLRIRGVYKGPVDGTLNKDFVTVVPLARKALGLSEHGDIDEAMFSGLINLKSKDLGGPKNTVAHLTIAQLNTKSIKKNKKRSFNSSTEDAYENPSVSKLIKPRPIQIAMKPVPVGADIGLTVHASETSYAYCYYQETSNQWMRVFPNRYATDPLLIKGKPVNLLSEQKIQIKAGPKDQKEMLACFNTSSDISMELPPEVRSGDFEPNPELTLPRLRQAFSTATSNTFGEAVHEIKKY